MHDTYLLNRISQSLKEICEKNRIKRINKFVLVVSHESHINEENLQEHLELNNRQLIAENLEIRIHREDLENQTAIIHSIQGETFEA